MNSFPLHSSSTDVNPLAVVIRNVRRVCLLREQGNLTEAGRVEQSDLANAIRDIRLARGPEALPESELQSLFAREEKRVADAIALSELLIPELVKSFSSSGSNPPMARPGSAPVVSGDSAIPFPRAVSSAGDSPVIADLLDSMLASERMAQRSH